MEGRLTQKKLVSNLLKTPPEFTDILALHYDQHAHASSGLGWDVKVSDVRFSDFMDFTVRWDGQLLHDHTFKP